MTKPLLTCRSCCQPKGLHGLVGTLLQTGPLEQNEKRGSVNRPSPTDSRPMIVDYLEKLNPEQRRAVEHGVETADGGIGGPLLIIASMAPILGAFC